VTFFDAHCDTIQKVVDGRADILAEGSAQLTLPGLERAGVRAQVFAAWALSALLRGSEDEAALAMVEAVARLCRENPDRLVLGTTCAVIRNACAVSGPIAAIPSLEGADPLKGDVDALAGFHRAGVRLVTLAWADNPFCGTVFGSGGGLTAKGEDLVGYCEDLGVVVDVSHSSDTAFWDVCRASTRPFLASHSNCRALCGSPRNLSDEMIRALGERGGALGINLYSSFVSRDFAAVADRARDEILGILKPGDDGYVERAEELSARTAKIPRPPLDMVVAHVRHAIRVGGEDCVGVGGDLDGMDSLPQGIDSVSDYPRIAEALQVAGFSEHQVEKVCWRNLCRVFEEILPG
jgi:membrane dipeptidase